MKKILTVTAVLLLLCSFTSWETDFDVAKQKAKESQKYILLNFSGSDWCGPCRRFWKDFLETDDFQQFADSRLILLNADFPRQKKNQLSKAQQQQNDKLADKYNTTGAFPLTLLMDASGNVLKSWNGVPKGNVDNFTVEIETALRAAGDKK
jgi:thioredoxin-related protein